LDIFSINTANLNKDVFINVKHNCEVHGQIVLDNNKVNSLKSLLGGYRSKRFLISIGKSKQLIKSNVISKILSI